MRRSARPASRWPLSSPHWSTPGWLARAARAANSRSASRCWRALHWWSAAVVAFFSSLNKRLVEHADPLTVTALELGAGALALTLLAPLMSAPLLSEISPAFAGDLLVLPDARDAMYLLALALACTMLPFALSLVALRHMSAFAAQLAVNLEPVYAIILAIVLLGEQRELTP